jgi:cytochrome b561
MALWVGWIVLPFIGILDSYFNTLEWKVLFFMMLAAFFRSQTDTPESPGAGAMAAPDSAAR